MVRPLRPVLRLPNLAALNVASVGAGFAADVAGAWKLQAFGGDLSVVRLSHVESPSASKASRTEQQYRRSRADGLHIVRQGHRVVPQP